MVMGRLYDKIISLSSLNKAWAKVRADRGAAGVDGQGIASFERNLEDNLQKLHETLAQGTYQPRPIKKISIPQEDGAHRLLYLLSVRDRVVQTSVALVLGPILDAEMEDASFAHRPGRSVRMAVERVARYYRQGYHWVVDGDIDDYFESVPHDRLLETLGRYLDDARVLELISNWLKHGTDGSGIGLPQGSPLSPLLANIYLDEIDERIHGKGIRLVRFADDFVLLAKKEVDAQEAVKKMAGLLEEYGLRLHPEKTRVVSFEQGFSFLGRLFVRSVVLEHEPGGGHVSGDDTHPAAGTPSTCATSPSTSSPPVEPLHQAQGGAEDLAPRLRVLYITGQGRFLDVRNRAFSVRAGPDKDSAELIAVLPRGVERIELWPGADASSRALRHALDCKIVLAYVDGWGRTRGTLEPPLVAKAKLHLAQAEIARNGPPRLDMARRLAMGRVRNQRALLRRLNRRRRDEPTREHLAALNSVLRRQKKADNVPRLMGLEAEAAKHYWTALSRQVGEDWHFTRRVRRPPGDPINLVISLTASILYRDLHCLVVRHGLHPGFGSLHGSVDGRHGCVSDLIEEFRAPLSEGLAVYLANNRILKADMFHKTEKRLCQVTPEGRNLIIRSYEAWLDRPIKSPHSGKKVKWRGLLEEQVLAYREHVLCGEPYRPYAMDY